MLVKWLVIVSMIYRLCNGITITRQNLSSAPELSKCPGSRENLASRQLYFKERVSQPADPPHALPLHDPAARGGGGRAEAFKPHFAAHFLGEDVRRAPTHD